MPLPKLSLRTRLAAWFVLTFAAIQIVLAGFGVLIRYDALKREFDDQLLAQAQTMVEQLRLRPRPWGSETAVELAAIPAGPVLDQPILVTIWDLQGHVLGDSSKRGLAVAGMPSAEADGPRFVHLSTGRSERLLGRDARVRVVTVPFRTPDGDTFFLSAATDSTYLHESMEFVGHLFLIGIPLGIVAAAISGWFIAGRAISLPLKRMTEAAQAVSPERLESRFHVDTQSAELAKLEQELNDALERLEQGYRAQERFISNVSHELKTPIAVLLSEAQVLQQGQPTPDQFEEFRLSVEDEMRRLGRLVESFLALTRTEHRRRLLREIPSSINDVVVEAIDHCGRLADLHEVDVVSRLLPAPANDAGGRLVGDPDLLRTMFDNLIRNAIQYSPAGRTVEVEVDRNGHCASVTVRDQGPGIPEEYIDKIFDRYAKAPSRWALGRGSNLGLAIAHRVAELHGGTLSVRNQPDGGCAFRVELPLRRSEDDV